MGQRKPVFWHILLSVIYKIMFKTTPKYRPVVWNFLIHKLCKNGFTEKQLYLTNLRASHFHKVY